MIPWFLVGLLILDGLLFFTRKDLGRVSQLSICKWYAQGPRISFCFWFISDREYILLIFRYIRLSLGGCRIISFDSFSYSLIRYIVVSAAADMFFFTEGSGCATVSDVNQGLMLSAWTMGTPVLKM